MGIRIKFLLFDAGFASLALLHRLEGRGYTYAMRFPSNEATKRIGLKDGEEAFYPSDNPFRIVRADDPKTARSYLLATNMTCRPKRVLKRYKLRWGIETSYREHNVFLAKTTSRDYTVRLLYYAVAICIYNAWCIFNVNQEEDRRVIALELKVCLLLASVISCISVHTTRTNDHG
jgi:IS4 transposase